MPRITPKKVVKGILLLSECFIDLLYVMLYLYSSSCLKQSKLSREKKRDVTLKSAILAIEETIAFNWTYGKRGSSMGKGGV